MRHFLPFSLLLFLLFSGSKLRTPYGLAIVEEIHGEEGDLLIMVSPQEWMLEEKPLLVPIKESQLGTDEVSMFTSAASIIDEQHCLQQTLELTMLTFILVGLDR